MIDSRLNYVVAVARSGSFTAAAQAVGVTQSTVTKSVADLERQLGYPLFHRTGRGALATDKGRDFIDRAERILGDTRDLFEGSLSTGDPVSGALRIGACPPSLEWCLAAPVMELLRRHANVRLEISSSSSERMVQQLRHGAVDVAFGYDAVFQEWPDLHREATGELESALFVRKGHPALTQAPAQLSSLMEYDFVCPPDLLPYGAGIRSIYESWGIEWRRKLHFIDYLPVVEDIVANSDAIGLVTLVQAAAAPFREKFVTLEHLNSDARRTLSCAVLGRWEPKPAVRAFISAARAQGAILGR